MKNLKIALKVVFCIIISACSTNTDKPNVSTVSNTVNNIKKTSNFPLIETKNEEEIIKDIINNDSNFFPLDLNSDNSSQATVPNNGGVIFATVPNNGDVIFGDEPNLFSFSLKSNLSTKQLRFPIRDMPIPQRPKILDKIKNNLPAQWKREIIDKPRREIKVTFEGQNKAKAVINTFFNKKLVLNFVNKKIVKKINEISTKIAYFVKEDNKWILESLSPFEFKPENKKTNISIESMKVTIKSDNNKTFEIPINNLISKKDIPVIKKSDVLQIEVKAINNEILPLYVYLRIPNIGLRIPMYDDGSLDDLFPDKKGKQVSTDTNADDDIYTATIKISKNTGINHITIESISSLSLEDSLENGDYISKSFPIIIK